jgi:hypothetical protein
MAFLLIYDALKGERWPKSAKWQEAHESEISPSCSAGGASDHGCEEEPKLLSQCGRN